MQSRRGQAEQRVSRPDPRTVDQPRPVDDAHDESCQVVLAGSIEIGHLGSLAADQRTTCLATALRQACDDLLNDARFQPAAGDIVEEVERTRPLDHYVRDAVRHEVVAHRVVNPGHEGHLQLGTYAVTAGDEERFRIAAGLQAEKGAEASDVRQYPRRERRTRQAPDTLLRLCRRVDVHPRRGIGHLHARSVILHVMP